MCYFYNFVLNFANLNSLAYKRFSIYSYEWDFQVITFRKKNRGCQPLYRRTGRYRQKTLRNFTILILGQMRFGKERENIIFSVIYYMIL